jgi:arginyl-tRNA synthetase
MKTCYNSAVNIELAKIIKQLYDLEMDPEVSRPDPKFGDFATNVALQLAGKLNSNPRIIAEQIVDKLTETKRYKEISIAGPGFINVFIKDDTLLESIGRVPEKHYANQNIVFEYSCPNAFKELHTGHLYQTVYGDITSRLMLLGGAKLKRTSFGGDVGLHVAKCLWGMVKKLDGENPDKLSEVGDSPFERSRWISSCYVYGSKMYEDDANAKSEIDELNKTIYGFHDKHSEVTPLEKIYWETRQWSFDYFGAFYDLIKVEKMQYFAESETAPVGMKVVSEQLKKGKLKESDGAIVFEGDESKHLHTRVFVTSRGLPTYETKDIGVIWLEQERYGFDRRYIITGNDQKDYMRVVFAAAETFQPPLVGKMVHMTNGTVKFADGQKMSSRLGNVTRAIDVLDAVREKVSTIISDQALLDQVTLGAVKYAFARYKLGGDIAFNIDETVSLTGNSGPYLQYAHARARRIIEKASVENNSIDVVGDEDRLLVSKLGEYSEIISLSVKQLEPHHICNYLFELAQEFNRYYEKNRVIGSDNEGHRVALVRQYANTIRDGLAILGIHAPDTM